MASASRAGLTAAFTLVAALAGARHAAACDCVGVPTSTYLEAADVVYTGRVVDIRTDPRRFAWPEIEFRVERMIKGKTEGTRFVLVTPAGRGVNCRGFDFVVGEAYLVFASARESESKLAGTYGVNWCAGTVLVESDEGKKRLRETLSLQLP